MRIQHNIMAMNSYRNYTANNQALSKNLEKLSSGYKINRAGDDAAGLAISEKMRAQITGLKTAQNNAQSGINLVQTAEGALTEVHDMLNRMVELADQSANGTYDNNTDRANLQKEFSALSSEMDRIADASNFNGIKLLDGSLGGARKGAVNNVATSVAASTVGTQAATAATLDATVTTVPTTAGAKLTVNYVDADGVTRALDVAYAGKTTNANEEATAIKTALSNDKTFSSQFDITGTGADIKVTSKTTGTDAANVLSITSNAVGGGIPAGTVTKAKDSKSVLTLGANMAAGDTVTLGNKTYKMAAATDVDKGEFADVVGLKTLAAKDGILLTNGAGANPANLDANTELYFEYDSEKKGAGLTLQIGDTSDSYNQITVKVDDMHAASLGLGNASISTQEAATAAVSAINEAINKVSGTRGDLGATQNRLEHTINNLSVMTENVQDAEANIRDVDVAEEMMEYTKNNILVQSAQAMLAQANQVPQGVLQLLQ